MKKLLILICGVGFFFLSGWGMDINGYFEYRYSMFNLEKTENSNQNKFRFDFKFDNGKKVTLNGDFVIEDQNGFNEFSIYSFIPEYTYDELWWYMIFIPDTFGYEDRAYLDNGYLSIYTKHLNLRVGKQQLNWGVGYFWRPTDIFNTRDIIQPEYEKEGINALKAEIKISGFWKLQFTYLPENNYRESNKAYRLKGQILDFDFEIFKIDVWKESFLDFPTNILIKKDLYGATLNGELLGLGTWVEYGYDSIDGFDEGYSTFVLGFDYTFEFQTYVMGEFFKDDSTNQDSTEYPVISWLDYLSGYRTTLGPEYSALMISQPISELIDISMTGITNHHDESVMILFNLLYNLEENLEVEVLYLRGFGEKDTEFDLTPETTFAYLKYYF